MNFQEIRIKRGVCFGTCPIYDFFIFPDGSFEYLGIKYVEKTGKHSHQLSPEIILKIKDLLSSLEGSFTENYVDLTVQNHIDDAAHISMKLALKSKNFHFDGQECSADWFQYFTGDERFYLYSSEEKIGEILVRLGHFFRIYHLLGQTDPVLEYRKRKCQYEKNSKIRKTHFQKFFDVIQKIEDLVEIQKYVGQGKYEL